MKKTVALLMAVLTLCMLCACKKAKDTQTDTTETSKNGPWATDETDAYPAMDEGGPGAEDTDEGGPDEENDYPTDYEIAVTEFGEGQVVEDLIAMFGEPLERQYDISVHDSAVEEGTLTYAGFIVYTQKEDGEEWISGIVPRG